MIEIVNKSTLFRIATEEKLEKEVMQFVTDKQVPIPDASKAIVAAIPVMSAELLVNVVHLLDETKDDTKLLLVGLPETMVGKTLKLNHVKVGLSATFLWIDKTLYEEKYKK